MLNRQDSVDISESVEHTSTPKTQEDETGRNRQRKLNMQEITNSKWKLNLNIVQEITPATRILSITFNLMKSRQ